MACYYLAVHPELQDRVRAEAWRFCGADSEPDLRQLGHMKVTEALIKEILRLHPLANM